MDNFVDKVSQRINAQEMIKANVQAEANEMQRLQEQVAQYEAILQDMRKLNYKNTELTDKIGAWVDESMLPVDQMKQSSLMVSDSVSEVRQIAEDVRSSVDEVRSSSEELKTSVKASMDNAILTMRRENREIAEHLEYIRTTVDNIKAPGEEDEELREEEARKREEAEREREEQRIAREEENKKALEEMFKQSDDFVHKENVRVYRNVQAVVVDEFKNQTDGLTKHNQELYERLKSTRMLVIIAMFLGFANVVLTVLMILGIL